MKHYFDECDTLSTKPLCTYRAKVKSYNTRINNYKHLLLRSVSKQAAREYVAHINYLSKQRDSILNLYPEYFI